MSSSSSSTHRIVEHIEDSPVHQTRFHLGPDDGESDVYPAAAAATTSRSRLSFAESLPTTPRSFFFTQNANPFSPPASVRSFSSPTDTPMQTPAYQPSAQYPFPESGAPRSGASTADISRTSSSHFTPTAEHPRGYLRSSMSREAFASPPPRPLTIYNTPVSSAKVVRDRPKSTMLVDDGHLDKPWMGKRNKHDKLAYFLTYTVAFLGIVGGALKCYFDYRSVSFITSNLCPVLDVNFDTDQDIFGDNGVFFREVDMSGFGYAYVTLAAIHVSLTFLVETANSK